MEIFIAGAGFGNKGAESMLRTVQAELMKRIPNVHLHVRLNKEHSRRAADTGLVIHEIEGSKLAKIIKLFCRAFDKQIFRAMRVALRAASEISENRNIDAVIDISGYSFSELGGVSSAKHTLAWTEYCSRMNVPYIFMPQAMGPFLTPRLKLYTGKALSKSSKIYARDRQSMQFVLDLRIIDDSKLSFVPDMVFVYNGSPIDVGRELLKEFGVGQTGKPIIGVTPNRRIYDRMAGKGVDNKYVKLLSLLIKYCMDEFSAEVVMIPYETFQNSDDDLTVAEYVREDLGEDISCSIIDTTCSSETIKSIVSNMDLLIGSRYHSIIHALASAVPVFALSWSHKYSAVMSLVGLEKYCMEHDKFSAEEIKNRLNILWERREYARNTITERLPGIKSKVNDMFDEVACIIRTNISRKN